MPMRRIHRRKVPSSPNKGELRDQLPITKISGGPSPSKIRHAPSTLSRIPKITIFLVVLILGLILYGVVVTIFLSRKIHTGDYLSQLILISTSEWEDFRRDYQKRFGRLPPDSMKEWLRYARYYECNERDFYYGIEEDLKSFRKQANQNGLFSYWDVIPSGLKQTNNYMAFQIDNNEIRTVASHNVHLDFVLQAKAEKHLLWILEPLRLHDPPVKTVIFFDLHDHPTNKSTAQSLPIFSTTKMAYVTDHQTPPIDKELPGFLAKAFGTTGKTIDERSNKLVFQSSPYHPNYPGSYDCRSILVPYWDGLKAAHADPLHLAFHLRNDTLLWRGSTTGYDWGDSPRFRLMDLFTGKSANQPHPMPKGSNPIVPGVGADLGFVQVVQNYTSNLTMGPKWRMVPFMDPDETRMYKYIMDVDGNAFTNRYPFLLRLGSVVFKSTRFREWFSERLQPFVDYIPVNYDLSDLREKVAWIHGHPEVAERIVDHGINTSMHHIRDEDMRCYTYRLVLEYATLFQPDW